MAYEGDAWEALKVALKEGMTGEIEKIFSLLETGQILEEDFQELVYNDAGSSSILKQLEGIGFNFRQFTI